MNHKQIIQILKKNGHLDLATSYSRLYVPIEEADLIWKELDEDDARFLQNEIDWHRTRTTEPERLTIFEDEYREYLKTRFENEVREFYESGGDKLPERLVEIVSDYKRRFEVASEISQEEISRANKTPINRFIEVKGDHINCPFHHEKSPSCHITENLFYCFGCGEGGDTIKFIMKLKNLEFKQAVKFING